MLRGGGRVCETAKTAEEATAEHDAAARLAAEAEAAAIERAEAAESGESAAHETIGELKAELEEAEAAVARWAAKAEEAEGRGASECDGRVDGEGGGEGGGPCARKGVGAAEARDEAEGGRAACSDESAVKAACGRGGGQEEWRLGPHPWEGALFVRSIWLVVAQCLGHGRRCSSRG